MLQVLKNVAKGSMAILSIALLVTIAVHVVSVMYDLRLIVAAGAGAFGYEPLYNLFNKIKALQ